jgi:XisH protein
MPAKDLFHDAVKAALVKDGWTVTHDPLTLKVGKKDLFVDLGAEKLLSAERGAEKIAIEVKSFVGPSEIKDLELAIGQYVMYEKVLRRIDPGRVLYLAIREASFQRLFQQELGMILLEDQVLKLFIFNPDTEEVLQWIAP